MATIYRKNDERAAHVLAAHLLEHQVAIIPCDTIYGIVGIAPESESILRTVKGRPETKPFIQLISRSMLARLTNSSIPPEILALWPGPLTVIVGTPDGRTVAVREPADPFLQQVLTLVDQPLFSTSVNVSGEAEFTRFDEMVSRFSSVINLFIESDAAQGSIASTIVDITSRPYRLIRQGALDVTELLRDN